MKRVKQCGGTFLDFIFSFEMCQVDFATILFISVDAAADWFSFGESIRFIQSNLVQFNSIQWCALGGKPLDQLNLRSTTSFGGYRCWLQSCCRLLSISSFIILRWRFTPSPWKLAISWLFKHWSVWQLWPRKKLEGWYIWRDCDEDGALWCHSSELWWLRSKQTNDRLRLICSQL